MKKLSSKDAKEIGENIGISWKNVRLSEFAKGINVEFEHGTRYPETNITNNDIKMTGKIAWAHLKEFPDYYTRLKTLEREADKFWKSKAK